MLEFPQELYHSIATFIQWCIYHPLLWQDLFDSSIIPNELIIDEKTIELGKFIMMGESNYFLDASPVRMYGSQKISISKMMIKEIALQKYEFLQSLFQWEKNQIVLQGNLRGIDIVLVNFVKNWEKIIYVEPEERMLLEVKKYFTQDNIIFKNA